MPDWSFDASGLPLYEWVTQPLLWVGFSVYLSVFAALIWLDASVETAFGLAALTGLGIVIPAGVNGWEWQPFPNRKAKALHLGVIYLLPLGTLALIALFESARN